MIQNRSKAFLRQLCERPAVDLLRVIVYHSKLHYSEKVLSIALLLEPGFSSEDGFKTTTLKRGLKALLARKFQVPESSISIWLKRISEVADLSFKS